MANTQLKSPATRVHEMLALATNRDSIVKRLSAEFNQQSFWLQGTRIMTETIINGKQDRYCLHQYFN